MKTLLVLMMTFSLAVSTNAFAKADADLSEKISSFLDDAEAMPTSQIGFKKLITINALESLANSNIDDPKLIKRVTDRVINLDQAFTTAQKGLIKRSLVKIQNR